LKNGVDDDFIVHASDPGQMPDDIFDNDPLMPPIHRALKVKPSVSRGYLNRFRWDRGQHFNCIGGSRSEFRAVAEGHDGIMVVVAR